MAAALNVSQTLPSFCNCGVPYRNVFVTTDTFVTRDTHRKGGFEGRKNIRLLCFVTTDTQVKHLQSPKV